MMPSHSPGGSSVHCIDVVPTAAGAVGPTEDDLQLGAEGQ